MSEHITIPALTGGSDLPASVEPKLASYWLRERLGFQGVLTTDDLWYPKVVKRFGAERAGVMAVQAGHDVLLKPANAVATIEALVRAVESGDIPLARIDASVEKILYSKARLGLHRDRFVDPERIGSVVGAKAHRDLVREVAERSLTALVDRGVFPAKREALGTIVYVSSQKNEGDPAPLSAAQKMREGLSLRESFLLGPGVDPARYDAARRAGLSADTVVVSLFHQRTVYRDRGVLPSRDLELIRGFAAAGVRTLVLSFGNPYLAEDLPGVSAFVVGYGEGGFYGNQLVYADAFVRLLKGEITAFGKTPRRRSRASTLKVHYGSRLARWALPRKYVAVTLWDHVFTRLENLEESILRHEQVARAAMEGAWAGAVRLPLRLVSHPLRLLAESVRGGGPVGRKLALTPFVPDAVVALVLLAMQSQR